MSHSGDGGEDHRLPQISTEWHGRLFACRRSGWCAPSSREVELSLWTRCWSAVLGAWGKATLVLFEVVEGTIARVVLSLRKSRFHRTDADSVGHLHADKARKPLSELCFEVHRDHEVVFVERLRELGVLGRPSPCLHRLLAAMWILVTVVLLPVTLLVIVSRSVVSLLRPDITVWQPRRSKACPQAAPLVITTFNVALSEINTMNVVNGLRSSRRRALGVLAESVRHEPDVLCWQEMFSAELVASELAPRLAAKGYWVAYAGRPRHPLALNSGLLVATKHPILQVSFESFLGHGGEEFWANKGVLAVAMEMSTGAPIVVATLHAPTGFRAPSSSTVEQRRTFLRLAYRKYFVQAKRVADALAVATNAQDVLIAGDFNMGRFSARGSWFAGAAYDASNFGVFTDDGYKVLCQPHRDTEAHMVPQVHPCQPDHNETGNAYGTVIDLHMPSCKYAKHLWLARVTKTQEEDDEHQAELRRTIFRKTSAIDHVLLRSSGTGALAATGYTYIQPEAPFDQGLLVSDHCALTVHIPVTTVSTNRQPVTSSV